MSKFPSTRTRAFVSYSHADEEQRKRLRIHLAHYIREQNIDVWDDTRIAPGVRWKEEIKAAIASAKVAILLVSADFLASEFIASNELPPLLEAAEQDGLRIFQVILSPCAFQQSKLASYQTFNKPSEALIGMPRVREEEIWAKLAEQVAAALRPAPAALSPSRKKSAASQEPSGKTNEETAGTAGNGRIIDCWVCQGKGHLTIAYKYVPDRHEDCYFCKGSGKLWVPAGYREETRWFSTQRFVLCQSCGKKSPYAGLPLPRHCASCGTLFL